MSGNIPQDLIRAIRSALTETEDLSAIGYRGQRRIQVTDEQIVRWINTHANKSFGQRTKLLDINLQPREIGLLRQRISQGPPAKRGRSDSAAKVSPGRQKRSKKTFKKRSKNGQK